MNRAARLENALTLLRRLISTPSPSREESATADIWEAWLRENGADSVSTTTCLSSRPVSIPRAPR